MYEFFTRVIWLVILLMAGLGLAIKKLAEHNPDEAAEVKQKAGAKAISFIERLLK